ncbi:MAG: MATE family efflux transporter [Planctomycetes bacterium]|nr:MATE family efflux transporter [Planctomycetota bacterium]
MTTWNSELRATLRLATPIVVAQLGQMGLGAVDVLMVGNYSDDALAGIAMGHVLFWSLAGFGYRVVTGIDPLAARSVGAGDRDGLRRACQGGLAIAVLLTIPLTLIGACARPILGALGQPAAVREAAGAYVLWSLPGLLPFLVFCALRQTLQAMARPRPVMVVLLAANVLNAIANYALIYGRLGMPELGLIGSAIASTIARVFLATALLTLAWPLLREPLREHDRAATRWRALRPLVALGLPVGGQFLLESGAFSATAVMMGWIGGDAVAGHQVALTLAALSFMVPVGISLGAAVRVGHAIGRGDEPGMRRAAIVSIALGAAVMLSFAALFVLAPTTLARLFSKSPEIVPIAALLIPLAGVFQVSDGVQVVCGGVLRGLADTRTAFVAHLLSFWAVGLPIGYLLAFERGHGAAGLWWGLVVALSIVAVALLIYVIARVRRMRIEPPPAAGAAVAEA